MSKIVSILLALALALTLVPVAFAADSETLCGNAGGAWSGSNGSNGRCTYPAGSSEVVAACGGKRYVYTIKYVADVQTDAYCTAIQGSGRTSVTSDGARSETFTLRLKNGKAFVTFHTGCQTNCSINSNLPVGGEDTIYVTPLATLMCAQVQARSATPCVSEIQIT